MQESKMLRNNITTNHKCDIAKFLAALNQHSYPELHKPAAGSGTKP